jgi:hypothetical protein
MEKRKSSALVLDFLLLSYLHDRDGSIPFLIRFY